jgi:hypothetical protein
MAFDEALAAHNRKGLARGKAVAESSKDPLDRNRYLYIQ